MTGLDTRNLLCCRCPCHRDTWRQWWTEPACHPSPYHCFLARTSSAAYHNSAPATHSHTHPRHCFTAHFTDTASPPSHTHNTASLPTLQTLLHRLVTPTTLLHCPLYRHCFTAQSHPQYCFTAQSHPQHCFTAQFTDTASPHSLQTFPGKSLSWKNVCQNSTATKWMFPGH